MSEQAKAQEALFKAIASRAAKAETEGNTGYGAVALRNLAAAYRAAAGGPQPGGVIDVQVKG